jgi:lipopolysaccharide/colanic/teichoic acid biosynthesis glycosyltransferase
VRFSGSVVIGAGSEVGDGARIVGPVSIGDGCTVAQRATVVRSVLWNGVHVAGGAVVRDAVLTDEAAVPESVRISDALVVNSSARSDCCKRLRRVAQAGPPVLMGRDGRLAPLGAQPAGARVEAAIRRLMDVVFAAGVLLVAMPVVALSAIAIKLDSKGPVLFRQYRCGRGGRVFPMLKLRTMVPDAPRRKAELLDANEVDGPMFKMRGDPRITRVGRILRAASIDELPQMVNVLLGHMSLVGPRPLAPHEMALAPAWRDLRLTVKPGVTGLWQVRGRGIPRFADWISYDVYYVTHQSLLLDLQILLATPLTVLRKVAGK